MLLATYYCQTHIEMYPASYEIFASPFQLGKKDPLRALKSLDACLPIEGFCLGYPLVEIIPSTRTRERPNLKIWARMTVDTLSQVVKFLPTDTLNETADTLVAHILCHWQVLIKALLEADFENYEHNTRTNELLEICNILGKSFAMFIQDEHNHLKKSGKHALFPIVTLT